MRFNQVENAECTLLAIQRYGQDRVTDSKEGHLVLVAFQLSVDVNRTISPDSISLWSNLHHIDHM